MLAIVVACGGGTDAPKGADKPVPVGKDSSAVDDKAVAKAEAGDAKAEAGDAKAEAGDAKVEAGADDAKAADDGKAADEAKAADESGGDAPPDPAALQTEIKNKKTTDDRALAALAELETAGTKVRDVAKAANDRGTKLFDDPERAKKFFEWAAAKDPKYPDPVFNLAKQSATLGEVDPTVVYLTDVKKRGGKKLLTQIDFDPMWEIVKDDPRVRELLGGG